MNVVKAVFWPSATVVHARYVKGLFGDGNSYLIVRLSEESYRRLCVTVPLGDSAAIEVETQEATSYFASASRISFSKAKSRAFSPGLPTHLYRITPSGSMT